MALKDSFTNLNKALRTTLQNVPAVVDTLIRGFDEIGDAAEEQTTYSTDERVVGTWIDGRKIYQITNRVSITAVSGNWTNTNIDNSTSKIDTIISAEAFNNAGINWGFVVVSPNKGSYVTVLNIRSSDIQVEYLTIRYLKTSASRSPENGTKNGGDEEPDVKTVEEPAEELKK